MTEVTGTAVASLGEVDGMDVSNLGDALKEITSKATAAISRAVADIEVTIGSSSNSTGLVTQLIANTTSAATKSLGEIEYKDFLNKSKILKEKSKIFKKQNNDFKEIISQEEE